MSTPFIFLYLLLYLVVCFWRQKWALVLLFIGLPLYTIRFRILEIPATLLEMMILILFSVWFIKNFKQITISITKKFRLSTKKLDSASGQKNLNSRYPFDIEIILVLVFSLLAMSVSLFSNASMGIWKAYFFEPLLVYILLFNILFSHIKTETKDTLGEPDSKIGDSDKLSSVLLPLVMSLAVAAFYISVFAIYQKITGNFIPNEIWADSATRRVTGFYGYPNAIGLFLAPIFIIMLSYLLSLRAQYQKINCARVACDKWSPFNLAWFYAMPVREKLIFSFLKITSLLSILAIYFAKSEGAIVAIVAGIILMGFLASPFKSFGKMRLAIVGLALIFVTSVFLVNPLKEFVLDRIKLNDFSGQIRKAQWQETGIMLRDGHWLNGAGLAGYKEKIEPYHQNGIYLRDHNPQFDRLIEVDPNFQAKHWQPLEIFMYPHNIFLNFWVELGLFGMLIFLWIIFKVLYLGFLLLHREESLEKRFLILGAMIAMFVMTIHGIVDVPYFKNDLAIVFWIIVALMGYLNLRYQKFTEK